MNPQKLSWPMAAVIICVLVLFGTLSYFGKSFDVMAMLGVLGALGYVVKQQAENGAKTDAVQSQTNGNTTRMLDMLSETQRVVTSLLAAMPALPHDVVHDLTANKVPVSVSAPPNTGGHGAGHTHEDDRTLELAESVGVLHGGERGYLPLRGPDGVVG